MKVILLQNIKGLGRIGDIKNVSDGYARNFLFAKNLAKVATAGSVKEAEELQKRREVANVADLETAKKAAGTMTGFVVEFSKKASTNGTLFSSVTKQEISHELSKKSGLKITPDMLTLDESGEHIKHTGEHKTIIEFTPEIKTEVTVKVSG